MTASDWRFLKWVLMCFGTSIAVDAVVLRHYWGGALLGVLTVIQTCVAWHAQRIAERGEM